MADHEKILYTVDMVKVADLVGSQYFPNDVRARFTFRTRIAANKFVEKRNKKAKTYRYMAPQRAVWGPDN